MKEIRTKPAGRYAALGGTSVIIATAWIAFVEFASMSGFRMEAIDWALLALMIALVIGGSVAMMRFVRKHGAEIGEARFDTSNRNKPDRPGETSPGLSGDPT